MPKVERNADGSIHRVHVSISLDTRTRLKTEAAKNGKTVAHYIAYLLDTHLGIPPQEPTNTSHRSILARLEILERASINPRKPTKPNKTNGLKIAPKQRHP